MMTVPFLLQICALVFMTFAAFNLFPNSKVSWMPLSLVFWFLSFMIEAIGLHQAGAVH
jgi:uncharacterized protein (DUF486 family)